MNGITRAHYAPTGPVHRPGCPTALTASYQVSTLSEGDRIAVIHKYTTMQLSHQSKTGVVKNSLLLDDIHHELEVNALALQRSGSSNILLSKVSFDCLITREGDREERAYISFDLRIPGANTEREAVFSYEMIERKYGSKENLYAALKHFYEAGRARINPANHMHGHHPDYDHTSSAHDQYIRHTEQLLVAYLALPEAGMMLANRFRIELRSKYPDVVAVKTYNMALHGHTTKTCCAPCEYSFIGLMNERVGLIQGEKRLGFIPNFTEAFAAGNDHLRMTLPVRSLFRLVVTISAGEPDAHHKTQPDYTITPLGPQDPVPPYLIPTKHQAASNYLFTTMFNLPYDGRRLPASPKVADYTVGISGSRASRGSPSTIRTVTAARNKEGDEIAEKLDLLKI